MDSLLSLSPKEHLDALTAAIKRVKDAKPPAITAWFRDTSVPAGLQRKSKKQLQKALNDAYATMKRDPAAAFKKHGDALRFAVLLQDGKLLPAAPVLPAGTPEINQHGGAGPVEHEARKKADKLREQQEEVAAANAEAEARQGVARIREQAQAAQQDAARQRLEALRARVGSSGSGSDANSAGTGGVRTGGLAGLRLRIYQGELQAKIFHAWNIPPGSGGLQAAVLLVLGRTGGVQQARLVQGSGNALFDESLQRAIRQAQPLPSLPHDYDEPSLQITLHFRGRAG